MEFEFPYDRVGEPSNAGRTQAKFLRDQPGEYLQKEAEDGVWAYKQGEFLNVENEAQSVDGFYSLGRVTPNFEQRIVGSATARGVFTDRGPAVQDDGPGEFTTRQLFFYGRGLGSDYLSESTGTFTDFDGHNNVGYETTVYRTRDGRSMTPYYVTDLTGPVGSDLWATAFFIYPGAHYRDGDTLKFQTGWCYRTTVFGQHRFFFVQDDGQGNVVFAGPPPVADQIAAYAVPQRIGPKNFVMMETFVRPRYAVTSIDEGACPGLRFSFSDDNGTTWTPASSTEFYQEFFDTVLDLPAGQLWALPFNNATQAAGFTVVPLTATRALLYGVVPYIEVVSIPEVTYNLKAKVKIGIIDSAARTIISTLTLFDGAINDAGDFWRTSAEAHRGGAVVLERPIRDDGEEWAHPLRIMFTTDGVEYVQIGETPQPSYKVGLLTAVSPTQLFLPMYDGAHSLYESSDRGATWRKRATLSANGPTPQPNGSQFLQDFAVVTFLRNNGQPANGSPGTPWVCDARITAPV